MPCPPPSGAMGIACAIAAPRRSAADGDALRVRRSELPHRPARRVVRETRKAETHSTPPSYSRIWTTRASSPRQQCGGSHSCGTATAGGAARVRPAQEALGALGTLNRACPPECGVGLKSGRLEEHDGVVIRMAKRTLE
ncbi:hypothetical protein EDB87DRAFT_1824728 [Lactarius vividus]|nr:hypothetical protein EDB87DRAFT_1824728 [Lactarius vividus]